MSKSSCAVGACCACSLRRASIVSLPTPSHERDADRVGDAVLLGRELRSVPLGGLRAGRGARAVSPAPRIGRSERAGTHAERLALGDGAPALEGDHGRGVGVRLLALPAPLLGRLGRLERGGDAGEKLQGATVPVRIFLRGEITRNTPIRGEISERPVIRNTKTGSKLRVAETMRRRCEFGVWVGGLVLCVCGSPPPRMADQRTRALTSHKQQRTMVRSRSAVIHMTDR